MTMAWVRRNYRVPAKRGGRVEYTGAGRPEFGTIRSARGGRLMIQIDGSGPTMPFHPTWCLHYLDPGASEVPL
ncbi:hypothetical protein ACFPOB_20605 [Bosea eneae]|uniref:DUF1918 domain-containing protein n=1 Tax=Bosea eneae TaxID=151454 RepID=A0ABW0IV49_9HYPH